MRPSPPPPPPTVGPLTTRAKPPTYTPTAAPRNGNQVSPVGTDTATERSAVMADIRRGPRLKRVDRSLIQDRSEAALYFGEQDAPKTPSSIGHLVDNADTDLPTKSRKSTTGTQKLAGGANGAIQHPVMWKRPPSTVSRSGRAPSPCAGPTSTQSQQASRSSTPVSTTNAPVGQSRNSRRPSSALAAMTRVLARTPSPSASFQSVMDLFPSAARLSKSAASVEPPSQTTMSAEFPVVGKVKRPAPGIPAFNSTTPVHRTKWTVTEDSTNNYNKRAYSTPSPTLMQSSKSSVSDSTDRLNNHKTVPLTTKQQMWNSGISEVRVDPIKTNKANSSSTDYTYIASRPADNGRLSPENLNHSVRYSPTMAKLSDAISSQPYRTISRSGSRTRTQTTFEAKYTFHSVTELTGPEDFGQLRKTYPSVHYEAVDVRHRNPAPPAKRSLLA